MYNSLLLTFITIVEAGSMHKAATLLSLSASAVQKQIRKLEETVSVPLFVNAGKKIILTHAGEYFYKEALEYIKRSQTIIENTQLLSKKSLQ